MDKIHCSVSYHHEPVDKLDVFALGVRDGQFNNPSVFTSTPVTKLVFEGNIATYQAKRSAYQKGGSAQKGDFLIAKGVLMGNLDLFADSTDGFANGDEAIILLGGFVPTKGTDSAGHVPAEPVVTLKRGEATGVLISDCASVAGATAYGCLFSQTTFVTTHIDANGQLIIGAGEAIERMDLNKSRKKEFVGLTAGHTYYFYYYALNATGVSQLSEVKSILCA